MATNNEDEQQQIHEVIEPSPMAVEHAQYIIRLFRLYVAEHWYGEAGNRRIPLGVSPMADAARRIATEIGVNALHEVRRRPVDADLFFPIIQNLPELPEAPSYHDPYFPMQYDAQGRANFDPIGQGLGWTINYRHPDLERRLTYGLEMMHQIWYIGKVARTLESSLRLALLPENTPFTLSIAQADHATHNELIQNLGRALRVGDRARDVRLNLTFNPNLARDHHRVLCAQSVVLMIMHLGEILDIFENTLDDVLSVGNSPFTFAFTDAQDGEFAEFLNTLGRCIRVGGRRREYDPRLNLYDLVNDRSAIYLHLNYVPPAFQESHDGVQAEIDADDYREAINLLTDNSILMRREERYILEMLDADEDVFNREFEVPEDDVPETARVRSSAAAVAALSARTFEELAENEHVAGQACNICMEPFTPASSTLTSLPCQHVFHHDCVSTWLTEQYGRCPLCRAPFPEPEQ